MLSRQGSKGRIGGELLVRRPSTLDRGSRRSTVDTVRPRSPLADIGAAAIGKDNIGRSNSKVGLERLGSKENNGPTRSQSAGMLMRRATVGALPEAPSPASPLPLFRIPSKPKGPQRASAAMLVAKHRLEFHEVNQIVTIFEDIKKFCTGGLPITKDELSKAMSKIFEVDMVKPEFVTKVYIESKAESAFEIDKFLEWYAHNMFNGVAAMRGDQDRVASDKLVYDLAKSHQVSPVMIDKIKHKFDSIDEDGSGEIDCEEFKKMIQKILNAKSMEDISHDRVAKFFKEIDVDGSGAVDFSEFTTWYLKYFNQETDPSDPLAGGDSKILETFYDSFNPTNRRTSTLKNQ